MRQYEKRQHTNEYDHLVKLTCDLCGTEAKDGSWESGRYEINETDVTVTVHQKDGSSWPEGGSVEEYVIDLCPTCFTNRLVPWLRSEGANIEQKERDW